MAGNTMKSPLMLIAAAGLIGLVAGAAILYVRGLPSGNGQQAADSICAAKGGLAEMVAGAAKGDVAALLPAKSPEPMGELAFEDAAGKATTLAARAGKALLVNLWATWCVPCREEMPALDRLQQQKGGADFEVVTINLDRGGPEKPRAFLDEIGVKALSLNRDPTLKLFNVAKAKGLALGLPATFLLDKDGCLIAHMNGPADWAGPDATIVIDALRKG